MGHCRNIVNHIIGVNAELLPQLIVHNNNEQLGVLYKVMTIHTHIVLFIVILLVFFIFPSLIFL